MTSFGQTVKTVLNFDGTNGAYPVNSALVQGRDGHLYGTTTGDGITTFGTIFRFKPSGEGSTLYRFNGSEGIGPAGGVTLVSDGNFYGTTQAGGTFGEGTLFRVSPGGQLAVLYNFTGGADGGVPLSAPIEGSDGNLYGTTVSSSTGTAGTIYKYSAGKLTTIYSFDTAHGYFPVGLVQGTDGYLYASTALGGTYGFGSYLKVSTSGILKNTHALRGSAYGPAGALVQGSDGNLYGALDGGGLYKKGAIGLLNQTTGLLSTLFSLGANSSDGTSPSGALVQGVDKSFYGVTVGGGQRSAGVIFEFTSAGTYSELFSFIPPSNGLGVLPYTLKQHTTGEFFGVTVVGGAKGLGSIYSLEVGVGPFLSLQKYQGKLGSTTQILGQGLTGVTNVTYNGVPATAFEVVSDTYMTAVVPLGASSGSIVVTTPTGSLQTDKTFIIRK